jgi:CRP/FNR family transcriptional regulator
MATRALQLQKIFPSFEKELLAELEEKATVRNFPAGSVVARKGQYFRSAWIVLDGLVKVFREDSEGGEFFIYYLESTQACSQSLVCASRQEASEVMAIAVNDSEVLSIPLAVIDGWMTKYKNWSNFVLFNYRRRFEELLLTLDQVAFRNMDERLEFYLKRQVEKLGNHLSLTHQQVADDLNSSREVISRLLKNMEKNNRLRLHRSSIEWIR